MTHLYKKYISKFISTLSILFLSFGTFFTSMYLAQSEEIITDINIFDYIASNAESLEPFSPLESVKKDYPKGYFIHVSKKRHLLTLYENGEVLKKYKVNVRNEKADREIWEDDQTPEGLFTIETMNYTDQKSLQRWERWMHLDTRKKARALYIKNYKDGAERINNFEKKHGPLNTDQKVRQFNASNPDQKMLRGIGIHGGGYYAFYDWTQGCVALSNRDVKELFQFLKESKNGGIGTPVEIED